MTNVPATLISRRFRLPRLAATLALIAQVVAVGIAPAAEAVASVSAPAHVEAGGTHLHHSHNPADCPACTALSLSASSNPERPDVPRLTALHRALPRIDRRPIVTRARRIEPHTPRPPPLLLLASR
jgi:hypothetical protein